MPKMNSLNSEASILPRRMSAAFRRKDFELGEGDFLLFHLLPPLTLPPLRSPFAFRTPAGPSPSHMAALPACLGSPLHHHYPNDQGW